MAFDCGGILRQYSRYLLVIFNFLFALTGVLILSVGVSVKAYYNEYGTLLDNKYFYASDLLIVVGVIIFLIAFFGCCGALKENACMTLTYSTLLIVILVLEMLVGIGSVLLKNRTEDIIEKALVKTLAQYDSNKNNSERTHLWDEVQTRFSCCGVDNYTDWLNTSIVNTTHGEIPTSCCKIPSGHHGNFACNASAGSGLYMQGCLDVFSNYIKGHTTTMESVGLGLAVVQLLGIVLSCYLSKKIRSDYETV